MKVPMTPRGYDAMRRELHRLKAMRPQLANAIEVARAQGDLSENADYDAAKEHSGMVEAKIRDLDTKLSMAQVIDPRTITNLDRVVFGVSVKIEDIDSGESRTVTIVGADESNIEAGLLSLESPLAKGLIGKETGDEVQVKLPGGMKSYEISEIFVEVP